MTRSHKGALRRFEITIVGKVYAESDEEAKSKALLAAHRGDALGFRVTSEEIAYPGAPQGSERWARAAAAVRFAEDRKIAALYDDSWWWTDGHAMLRCDGAAPDGYRIVAYHAGIEKTINLAAARRGTVWRAADKLSDLHYQLATEREDFAVAADLIDLVEQSIPVVSWRVGERPEVPVLAYEGERLVAVVMGMSFDDSRTIQRARR